MLIKKIRFILIAIIFFCCDKNLFARDSIVVNSPDKKIQVTFNYTGKLTYSIRYLNEIIVQPSYADLILNDGQSFSGSLKLLKKSLTTVNQKIISPVPEKRKEILDNFNELTLTFRQPFSLQCRVYNDGVAYRFITRFKDSIYIKMK